MTRLLASFARFAAFAIVVAALAGFAAYVRHGSAFSESAADFDAEGIVALTGGENRVSTAADLLEAGRGARLLVTGANPKVDAADIAAAADAPPGLFDCCIDLGVEAADTVGNAEETARWAAEHGYTRLIIVTSDYHMPRAMLELQAAMPDAELSPHAVPSEAPWRSARAARRWTLEYVKYVAVYLRRNAAVETPALTQPRSAA